MLAKLINLKNWKAKRQSRVHPSDRKIKSPGKTTEALFYGNVHYPNGAKYVGEQIVGKYRAFHGLGMFIYGCGDKYVGEWKNHKRNGYGIYLCFDGSRLAGQWLDGVFVGLDQEKVN